MGQLTGKTALVTGGTSGIGLAAARRFAAEGAHVFLTGRRQEQLDEAVASIGSGATGVRGDVTVPADLDRVSAAVAARGQGLDVVFANAGGGEFGALGDLTWAAELADRGVRVNTLIPGSTYTPGLVALGPDAAASEAMLEGMAERIPLGRVAHPDEIANAALFLACDQSPFMTGGEIVVDGGSERI